MSALLSIQGSNNSATVLHIIQTTIDAEIKRLQLAIEKAKQRLLIYETQYQISSDYFIANMTAEDLIGGDDEYISWAGEFKLYQKLLAKYKVLNDIDYVAR